MQYLWGKIYLSNIFGTFEKERTWHKIMGQTLAILTDVIARRQCRGGRRTSLYI